MVLKLAGTSRPGEPNLRYVTEDPGTSHDIDLSGYERRCFARHRLHGEGTALLAGDGESTCGRVLHVELKDISRGGVGLRSAVPLDLGTRISVMIPAHGWERPMDIHGKVVRCHNSEGCFEIGIESAVSIAAA